MPVEPMNLRPELIATVARLHHRVDTIVPARRAVLTELARFVAAARRAGEKAHLLSVCTHNSGRSVLGEVWWSAAAAWFGLHDTVVSLSGGTHATAINPRVLHALVRAGFEVREPSADAPEGSPGNPVYTVSHAEGLPALRLWSKRFVDLALPAGRLAAVMNCSEADAACPVVPGAALRVSLPYADPRAADDAPDEREIYDARCDQVGTECLFAMAAAAS